MTLADGLKETFLGALQFPFRQRQKLALKARQEVSKCDFIAGVSGTDLEKRAAGLLWYLLVNAAMIDDFRLLPDDSLYHMYGLAEDDLDEDIILFIIRELGLRYPTLQLLKRLVKSAHLKI